MPQPYTLTPEDIEHLVSQGYDRTKIPATVMVADEESDSTALGSAARGAAASVVPTIAGAAGAGLATGVAGSLATGPLSPFVAIPAGLIGAAVGAIGASKAQEMVMPDVWKQKLAEDAKEHPYATMAGGLATMPLGGFAPAVKPLLQAGQFAGGKLLGAALPKVATEGGEMVAQTALAEGGVAGHNALINVAAGAGLGGAQEAGMELLRGEELDPLKIAMQAAGGAAFNKPIEPIVGQYNKLNATFGLKPGYHIDPQTDVDKGPYTGVPVDLSSRGQGQAVPVVTDKSATQLELLGNKQVVQTIEQLADASVAPVPVQEPIVKPEVEQQGLSFDELEAEAKALSTAPKIQLDVPKPDLALIDHPVTESQFPLFDGMNATSAHAGTDLTTGEPLYWIVRKGSSLKSANPKQSAVETKLDDTFTPSEQRLLPEQDLLQHTEGGKEFFNRTYAEHGGEMAVSPETPAGVRGQWDPNTRKISISPTEERFETRAHEILHDLWRRLPKPLKDAYVALTRSEYENWNNARRKYNETAKKPLDIFDTDGGEEWFARQIAPLFMERLAKGEHVGWQQQLKDIQSHLRSLKSGAKLSDVERSILARMTGGDSPLRVHVKAANDSVSEKKESVNEEWHAKNNKVATGSESHQYQLPEGITEGSINALKYDSNIDRLFNDVVRLNPELNSIRLDRPYVGPFNPKLDILRGVASRFKPENIKYFVEDLQGTLRTNPKSRVVEEGVAQIAAPKQSAVEGYQKPKTPEDVMPSHYNKMQQNEWKLDMAKLKNKIAMAKKRGEARGDKPVDKGGRPVGTYVPPKGKYVPVNMEQLAREAEANELARSKAREASRGQLEEQQPEVKQNVLEKLEQAVRARASFHGVKNPEDINDAIIAAKQELIERGIRLKDGVPDEEGTARAIASAVTVRMFREQKRAIKTTSLDKPSSFSGRTGHDLIQAQKAEEGRVDEPEPIGEEDIEPELPKTPAQLEEERLEREERLAAKVRGGTKEEETIPEHTAEEAIADRDVISALNARIAVEKLIERMDASGKYKNAIPKFEKLLGELEAMPDSENVDLGKIMKDRFGVKYSQVEEPTFTTRGIEMVSRPPIGLLNKQGAFNGSQLVNVLKNQLTPAEFDALSKAGLESMFREKIVSQKDAVDWMTRNSPVVQVHTYGMEGKVSEAKKEYDRMTHEWYENLTTPQKSYVNTMKAYAHQYGGHEYSVKDMRADWPTAPEPTKQLREQAEKYAALKKQVDAEPDDTSPRATQYYTSVSALPTNEPMPDWTSTKSGKNVQRVDVVLPVDRSYERYLKRYNYSDSAESRNRYRYEKDDTWIKNNMDLWQQDNLHENLPNTLGWAMIQYKTGPKGERIALVAEAQSRWGQEVRNQEKIRKEMEERTSGYQNREQAQRIVDSRLPQDHPLLRDYNRLILKAAIDQARKEGATHIMVSDAETAMMTEGHDAYIYKEMPSEKEANAWAKANPEVSGGTAYIDDKYYVVALHGAEAEAYAQGFKPRQEGGMRLNYDKVMPKIAEELTGSKGERVSLGEHKNAYPDAYSQGLVANEASNYRLTHKGYRDNLIFKNPDGSPKTDVSGVMYPLDKVSQKLQAGEKFTLFNKHSKVEEPRQKAFLRPLEAAFDKVERHSPEVAEALRRTEVAYRGYIGKANLAAKDLERFKREDVNAVMEAHREAYRAGKKDVAMSGQRREISNILRRYYGDIADIRRELGMQIEGRQAGKNSLYVPDMLNDKTLDLFMNKGTSPEAKYAKNLWAEHVAKESGGKISKATALEDINNYIRALGSDKNNYLAVQFGAIRKAAGYGLPAGLREKDAFTVLSKYGRRAASDLSMYKELETNERVAGALGLTNPKTQTITKPVDGVEDISAAVDVKNAMKWITGGFTGSMQAATPKVNSVVRLVNNALLGTATGIRDIVSVPVNTIPYITSFSDLGAAFRGLSELRKYQRAAIESGAKQPNIDKVQFQQMMDSPDRFSAVVNKVATGLRKWQGREALENLSRDITFAMGKEVVRNYVVGAKAGDKMSLKMVEKFKTGTEGDVLKMSGKELEKAIDTMAANFSDRIQGTYGGRGLPTGIADSQFAPFWALQKWGVEKSNTIYQDVITPFITGENRLPLITYTLGSVLTGAAIQELNELMSGKKGSDPTIKEVLEQGRAQDYVAQLATLMQLGSFAGVVGDTAKFASDVGIYGKTPRNAISFPTASAALDTQEKITDMLEALRSGENPFDVWKMFTLDLLTKNVQGARLVANRTVNEEQTEDSNELRALRIFRQLQGAPASSYAAPNKYLGINEREFKKEENVQKAASMMPGIIKRIMDEKDPIKIREKLEALKRNSFQSMPAPDRNPKEFSEFYQYLVRTQGRQEADRLMKHYFERRSVNIAKSSMIP